MLEVIKKNKEIAVFVLFMIIGLAVYANSFGNQFFWDDNDEIVNNTYVQHFDVSKMFTQNMIAGSGQVTNYYRPILLLSYALDYQLWGLNSFGFNFIDVILHILNAWLIFILLFFILFWGHSVRAVETHPVQPGAGHSRGFGICQPSREGNIFWLAFLPALIFLVHPLNTEAVDYVSGRADVLYSFFLLLSLIFWLRQSLLRQAQDESPRTLPLDCRGQIINYSAVIVFFILSLLAKETAVVLPFLILLIELFLASTKFRPADSAVDSSILAESPRRPALSHVEGETLPRPIIKNTWPLFAILAVYLVLHFTVLNFDHINGALNGCQGDYCSYNIWQRALVFLLVVLNYFKILFLPLGLHMERAVTEFGSIYSWKIFASLLAILIWAAAAIIFWKKEKGIAFGFFWFFILLAPTSGIAIKMLYPTYEHFLYLAMIGFWLSVFSLILSCYRQLQGRKVLLFAKIFFYVMLSFCVVFWGILTIQHNRIWHDPIIFYENNLKYSPQSFIEHTNLGIAYDDAGRYDEAIAQYEKSLAISDVYPQVHFDLANSLVAVKDYAQAEKEYQRTIEMDLGFGGAYRNLYNLYIYLGEHDKAQEILKEINKISNNK